jgi:hypothetical protein
MYKQQKLKVVTWRKKLKECENKLKNGQLKSGRYNFYLALLSWLFTNFKINVVFVSNFKNKYYFCVKF